MSPGMDGKGERAPQSGMWGGRGPTGQPGGGREPGPPASPPQGQKPPARWWAAPPARVSPSQAHRQALDRAVAAAVVHGDADGGRQPGVNARALEQRESRGEGK